MEKYIFAPIEDWVTEIENQPSTSYDINSPFFFSFVDYQELILPDKNASYSHTIEHINDASRIEDASLCIYEVEEHDHQVIFHSLDVIRDGEKINALNENNISITQREKSLENHVTNHQHTVSLSIDDLREGDIIDYKVTEVVTSSNHPIRGQYFYSRYWLGWSCPVVKQRIRIVNQTSSSINYQEFHLSNGEPLQDITVIPTGTVHEKLYSDLFTNPISDNAPDWLWTNHALLTTDISWNKLSTNLYDFYSEVDAFKCDTLIENIPSIKLTDNLEDNIISVIRFVQNEIRYKSESFGIFTHTPKIADITLETRRGDCKDKSNLAVALLKQLNVDAKLALVNTDYGNKLQTLKPSPYHFNHMVVHIKHEGKCYFFDATIKKQGGNLQNTCTLTYGYALVLDQADGDLIKVPHDLTQNVLHLKHTIDLTGYKSNTCTMSIRRKFFSHRADNMRYYLNSKDSNKLATDYLHYAQEEIDHHLSINTPLTIIEDDIINNILITDEKYNITKISSSKEDDSIHIPTTIHHEFPTDLDRYYPMKIELDGTYTHEIEAIYGHDPLMGEDEVIIKNNWFNYEDKVSKKDNSIMFLSRATPHKTFVKTSDLDNYILDVEKMRNRSSNNIPHQSSNSKDPIEPIHSKDPKDSKYMGELFYSAAFFVGLFLLIYFKSH